MVTFDLYNCDKDWELGSDPTRRPHPETVATVPRAKLVSVDKVIACRVELKDIGEANSINAILVIANWDFLNISYELLCCAQE